MIKAVVTDFDGVIRHWRNDKVQAIERRCKLAHGTLLAYCFEPEAMRAALLGQHSYNQWLTQIQLAIEDRYGNLIAEHTIEAFCSAEYDIDHDLLTTYRHLFSGAKLALATNATQRLPLELKEAGLHGSFDHIFNSSAMGVVKPERGFYHGLLITMGLAPQETLFIDDNADNVAAAEKAGMVTVHFQTRSQLLNDLTRLAFQHSLLA